MTLIQQLVVVSKLGIEWHAPVDEILKSLAIFGVDLDMIALPCVATVGPVLKYVLTVSVAPILAGIALALHLSAVAYKRYVWQGLKVGVPENGKLPNIIETPNLRTPGFLRNMHTPAGEAGFDPAAADTGIPRVAAVHRNLHGLGGALSV